MNKKYWDSIIYSQQDPLSHRIIEKRRRDRMNSCLADLSRLIPPQFQRKGRGRIEKTEIIEMSIRYMKQLQKQECVDKEYIYKAGFEDCLHHAASFLYSRNENICFKMVDYVRSHIDTYKKRKWSYNLFRKPSRGQYDQYEPRKESQEFIR